MKVKNLTNGNDRAIPNQFILSDDKGNQFFQSYNSIIIKWSKGKTQLDINKWNYSITTGKYRNQLLGEKKAETLKKIKSGQYILADLNG
jgi:hypothetical protein